MRTTEQHIREAHAAGMRHCDTDTLWSYYTGVLQAAYDAGYRGDMLADAACYYTRYGNLPISGRSYNYRDQTAEAGVSVIGHGGDAGAKLWMGGRDTVTIRGIAIVDRTGSDGELVVLPVDAYEYRD